MEDPAMQAMMAGFPADTKPMIFGGFTAILQA